MELTESVKPKKTSPKISPISVVNQKFKLFCEDNIQSVRLFLLQNFFKKVSYVVVCYLKKFTASEKFPTDAVLICDVMFIAVGTFDTHHFFPFFRKQGHPSRPPFLKRNF